MLLTWTQGRLSWPVVREVCQSTTHLTSMVFMILLGATTFSLVFRELGGDRFLVGLVEGAALPESVFGARNGGGIRGRLLYRFH